MHSTLALDGEEELLYLHRQTHVNCTAGWVTLELWAHTFVGELWNSGPTHSWGNFGTLDPHIHAGTLELWAYIFMGNFGTLGPHIHGGTLELWAHTFIGNFGTLGPHIRAGTLELWAHTFMGNFGALGPHIHGELWNSGPTHSWGNFGTLGPYIRGGTLELWAHTYVYE